MTNKRIFPLKKGGKSTKSSSNKSLLMLHPGNKREYKPCYQQKLPLKVHCSSRLIFGHIQTDKYKYKDKISYTCDS